MTKQERLARIKTFLIAKLEPEPDEGTLHVTVREPWKDCLRVELLYECAPGRQAYVLVDIHAPDVSTSFLA